MGAALAASEMLTSDVRLWHTDKSRRRMDHEGEPEPRAVQIAGADPEAMAEAARRNVDAGAQIIDINMGCPAKKVCNRLAGSALLRDEPLVARILEAVVRAVDVPVTLKTRTGWSPEQRNGVNIARIAESAGIRALAVHGRTRACRFEGAAEYETIRAIKAAVKIPVIANGDIDTPERALEILRESGADAVMIGRAAQGRPWIFREVNFFLRCGVRARPVALTEVRDILLAHLEALYSFYGEDTGVRVARKHLSWYCQHHPDAGEFRLQLVTAATTDTQFAMARDYFENHAAAVEGEAALSSLQVQDRRRQQSTPESTLEEDPKTS
jgi:tRNA-dihydrouridine synthase B